MDSVNFKFLLKPTPCSEKIYQSRWRGVKKLYEEAGIDLFSREAIFGPPAIQAIEGSSYSSNTKKNFYQLLISIHTSMGWGEPELMAAQKAIHEVAYSAREKPDVTIEDIEQRLAEFEERRPRPWLDKGYILLRIYLEVPVRDDLQLHLVSREDYPGLRVPGRNYIVKEPRRAREGCRFTVCLHKSKNMGPGRPLESATYPLSAELSTLICLWIMENSFAMLHKGPVLGDKSNCRLVKRMLTDLGFETGNRAINFIRIAAANSAKKTNNPQAILDTAKKSLHSVKIALQNYTSTQF